MSVSKQNYEKIQKLQSEYAFSQGHIDNLTSQVQAAVQADEDYVARARDAALLDGRAKAFDTLSQLVSIYASGGVVSGMYLFSTFRRLRLFVNTISIEENKAQYDKLVESAVGNDEAGLKLFKEAADSIYTLIEPHLKGWITDTEYESELVNRNQLTLMQKMIATGGVPKRGVKKGKR